MQPKTITITAQLNVGHLQASKGGAERYEGLWRPTLKPAAPAMSRKLLGSNVRLAAVRLKIATKSPAQARGLLCLARGRGRGHQARQFLQRDPRIGLDGLTGEHGPTLRQDILLIEILAVICQPSLKE
jgi:hypothetical protein